MEPVMVGPPPSRRQLMVGGGPAIPLTLLAFLAEKYPQGLTVCPVPPSAAPIRRGSESLADVLRVRLAACETLEDVLHLAATLDDAMRERRHRRPSSGTRRKWAKAIAARMDAIVEGGAR